MFETLALGLVALAWLVHRRNAYRLRWYIRLAELKQRINH